MEPIVSPWFIYAIGVSDGLIDALGLIFGILSVFFAIITIAKSITMSESGDGFEIKNVIGYPLAIVVMWAAFALLPNRNTLIGMAVAQNVTKDRVVKTGKVIYAAKDDLKKDIIDIVTALKTKTDATKGN